MTWEDLARLEPELRRLEQDILSLRRRSRGWRTFCANDVWYDLFKPRLVYLAGWGARNPALRSEEAYDLAYEHLYALLPDCRGCLCLPPLSELLGP